MARKIIKNEVRDEERAYYGSQNCEFDNVVIFGPADGESAFKECKNNIVKNSQINLRYPFWHNDKLKVKFTTLGEGCRAPLWYDKTVVLEDTTINGVKAFRECEDVSVRDCKINSEEVFWRVKELQIRDSLVNGVYGFFQCENLRLKNVGFSGKYSFQYCDNVSIEDSTLDTKDAFWHTKNVVVRNSIVKGEYLGWYSENLTFINCTITGTQPLCYAKGLKIINCTMEGCDLAFENSEVDAMIIGKVKSIKNPARGKVVLEKCEEFIKDEFSWDDGSFEMVEVN